MKISSHLLWSVCSYALAGIMPSSASAQAVSSASETNSGNQLEDIVVTAEKREARLQEVPVAVSVFGGEAIARAGAVKVGDLAQMTPGLVATAYDGLVQPFLRGIGNPVTTVGNESSTAIYMDGVYYSRLPAAYFDLYGIERVEVLKGPQGTLFGRNASGGLMHVITRDPTDTAQIEGNVGYGNFDTLTANAYVAGPVANGVRANIVGHFINQHDGWGTNVTTGNPSYREKTMAFRTKWIIDPWERTEIRLAADYVNSHSSLGQGANAYKGTTQGTTLPPLTQYPRLPFYDTRGDLDNRRVDKGWGASMRIQHDLDFATFVSLTAYRRDKGDLLVDGDRTPRPESNVELIYRNVQTSQEFQLTSNKGSSFDWILGLFYLNAKADYRPSIFSGDLFGGTVNLFGAQTVNSYAAYGQGTVHLTPTTNLTGGLRYTIDKVRASGRTTFDSFLIPGSTLTPKDEFKKLTWKAVIDQHIGEDAMVYASISRGYKAGTFNTLPVGPTPARPEVLDAYEIGLKSELFDRRLRLNGSLFWYDIKNPQVTRINVAEVIIENAKSARIKGAEIEAQAVLTSGLTLNAAAAYLHAKYRDFQDAAFFAPSISPLQPYGNGAAFQGDASGNYMGRAPKFTGSLGLNYEFESGIGQWDLNANYSYNDGYYWHPDNRLRQDSYSLVNASIGLTLPGDHWKITGWARNIGDKKYYSSVDESGTAGGDPSSPAPPRTYGVTVGVKF
jgi:iron complex outermembrane receptor protein